MRVHRDRMGKLYFIEVVWQVIRLQNGEFVKKVCESKVGGWGQQEDHW